MNCPNQECGEVVEPGWAKCPTCLTSLQMKCPNPDCNAEIKPKWKICPRCETPLSGSQTPSVGRLGQSSGSPQVSGSPVVSMPGQGIQAESGIILSNGERLLNRFTIKKRLGTGGFGAVYLAEDSERKQDIALKVVTTNIGQAEMAATQMRNELTLRDKINDFTHIIRTYDIHTVEAYKGLSLILMPMEYAEGNSSRNFLAANKRDDEKRIKEGVELFKQACNGVKAIHDAGLVHCDLKPENILICRDHKGKSVVKISDFGISRNVEQWSMNQAAVTQSSLGTPYYMSPEQVETARQKDIDGRADIYALGVILFEILDGDPPFDGTSDEVRKKHLNTALPPLKGVDSIYAGVANKCLEKDPKERYQCIEELIAFKSIPRKEPEKELEINKKREPEVQKEDKPESIPEKPAKPVENGPRYNLRSIPKIGGISNIQGELALDDQCKPHVYIVNEYKDNYDGTITDYATGLMWEQSGWEKRMIYESALGLVKSLNEERFAGYNDWRLPTTEELISLLEEGKQYTKLYIDDMFDGNQTCVWSADKRYSGSMCQVNFFSGYVGSNACNTPSYVRLVRSVNEEGSESSHRKLGKTEKKKSQRYNLRSTRVEVYVDASIHSSSNEVFGTDDSGKPHYYLENQYIDNSDGTVTDYATGLMWQQSGSKNVMVYEDVGSYVRSLNITKPGGYRGWRLPTVEELVSLLDDDGQDYGFHIDNIFADTQMMCWSLDKRAQFSAWYVNFNEGRVQWGNRAYASYVRLVRSVNEDGSESSHKKPGKTEKEIFQRYNHTGTVKWFNDSKGFGMISVDGGGDIYVHYTEILCEGFQSLGEGDNVEFEIVKDDKGDTSKNVKKI
jgi:serine/threonine protein kinase/cold shock CspA family protein